MADHDQQESKNSSELDEMVDDILKAVCEIEKEMTKYILREPSISLQEIVERIRSLRIKDERSINLSPFRNAVNYLVHKGRAKMFLPEDFKNDWFGGTLLKLLKYD